MDIWCYVDPSCESSTPEKDLDEEWNSSIAWSIEACKDYVESEEEKSAMLYVSALVMTAAAVAASL